jgi:hypothetical protein
MNIELPVVKKTLSQSVTACQPLLDAGDCLSRVEMFGTNLGKNRFTVSVKKVKSMQSLQSNSRHRTFVQFMIV